MIQGSVIEENPLAWLKCSLWFGLLRFRQVRLVSAIDNIVYLLFNIYSLHLLPMLIGDYPLAMFICDTCHETETSFHRYR